MMSIMTIISVVGMKEARMMIATTVEKVVKVALSLEVVMVLPLFAMVMVDQKYTCHKCMHHLVEPN